MSPEVTDSWEYPGAITASPQGAAIVSSCLSLPLPPPRPSLGREPQGSSPYFLCVFNLCIRHRQGGDIPGAFVRSSPELSLPYTSVVLFLLLGSTLLSGVFSPRS